MSTRQVSRLTDTLFGGPDRSAGQITQAGETRSASVESLRALAALGVVLAHTYFMARGFHGRNPGSSTGALQRLVTRGTYSVCLFFVLSGYLLYLPFAKQAFAAGPRIDLRRYAANRALRILPLYYVALVAYLVVERDLTLHRLLVFGTFSENFSTTTLHKVNIVLWSLVVELHFYLLLPLLALVVSRLARRSAERGLAVVAGLGLASLALRWITLYADPTPNTLLRDSLPSSFMFFAAGMALALLRLSWERRPLRLLAGPLGAGWLWVGGALASWLVLTYVEPRSYVAVVASFLLVGAVVLPLRNERLRGLLAWRPLAMLGVASYSLYLWHLLIIQKLSEHFFIQQFPKLLVVAGPSCILVAFVSYALVERPFLRLRRRWGATAAGTQPADGVGTSRDQVLVGASSGDKAA